MTDQSLPQLLESLNNRTRMARWLADICICIGAAIFTVQAIRATVNLIKRGRARCVPVDAQLLP